MESQSQSLPRVSPHRDSEGVQPDTWAAHLRRVWPSLVGWGWSLRHHTRKILSEVGSFRGRIETRNEKNFVVDLGPAYQTSPNGHLVPCTRTRARIRDTQSMLSSRPWASPVDLQTFLEGWDKGAEWASAAARNSGSCMESRDTETSRSPLEPPRNSADVIPSRV